MSKILKRQIEGFIYLLQNPLQLKHIIIRETLYRKRHRSKRKWIEWQKYDAQMHICYMHANPDVLRAEDSLNVARIKIVSNMINRLGKGLQILDVGCGDGVVSEPIRIGNYVTSIELPKVSGLAHICRVPLVVAGDAEHLTFASNTFDVVLASEVVEHLWNPHNFFNEARRVLKVNGHLIISTPEGKEGLRYDSHKHYLTVESVKQMLDSRFTICEVKRLKPTGAPIPTIILILRKS